jgi:hypothetical protein
MLELLLLITIIVPMVLIAYKTGRKSKKCEVTTMAILTLGSVFAAVLIYAVLNFDSNTFASNSPNVSLTEFDYV